MIFVVMGGTCSGKTEFAKRCVELGLNRVITNTTRNRRVDDKEDSYHFLTREEFEQKIKNNEMIEYAEYNDNLYGTSVDSISENCVIILEPNGYRNIKRIFGEKVYGIYLKVSEEERLRRGLLRGDNREVLEKRIIEDRVLFNIDLEQTVDLVLKNVDLKGVSEILANIKK